MQCKCGPTRLLRTVPLNHACLLAWRTVDTGLEYFTLSTLSSLLSTIQQLLLPVYKMIILLSVPNYLLDTEIQLNQFGVLVKVPYWRIRSHTITSSFAPMTRVVQAWLSIKGTNTTVCILRTWQLAGYPSLHEKTYITIC